MFENYTFAVGERVRVAHTEHCRPWNDHCIPLGKWMWRRNGDNVETAQEAYFSSPSKRWSQIEGMSIETEKQPIKLGISFKLVI